MADAKPFVLVVGATGQTGKSIVDGLIMSGHFRVGALVRPSSASKPKVEALRASGVEIRIGDMYDGIEKLKTHLSGVNILVNSIVPWAIADQKDIIRAAKEVGVERVVPCDFATPGARDVRGLHDAKLDIRDFIKDYGVGYTIIDVGWWMQYYLPLPHRSTLSDKAKELAYVRPTGGHAKNLLTNLHHIGTFVARILADPRTLNQTVIVWEDEVAQRDAEELGVRYSGDGEALREKFVHLEPEAFAGLVEEGKQEVAKTPDSVSAQLKVAWNQYLISLYVLEENTLANAKRLGYLDARELYPDVPVQSLEEFAKEFYSLQEPGEEWNAYAPRK
ncbi:NAD-P-binding protein [Lentinus brumalis]|uniref:NAD-P-binding protein n=1 Tax=Lentinus brumalis TaxID=2498619 RepID=A0A371CXQ0_9APHY|nr:NAD-P-binding protein [Polyporus brumalis]